ncbi:hypothetical protein [Streptomyces sp. TLI_105]|uniref:hypothetical protein n=1 Tax=Streptomyces sp. TLI_105 TaxID=1881019 RepID=UPI00210BF326|nr:hypothetical protein [Streptomyces sp. TLI_105]
MAAELGFQKDHVLAALGRPQRGRHPVDATADDGDLAVEVIGEVGLQVRGRVAPAGEGGLLDVVSG